MEFGSDSDVEDENEDDPQGYESKTGTNFSSRVNDNDDEVPYQESSDDEDEEEEEEEPPSDDGYTSTSSVEQEVPTIKKRRARVPVQTFVVVLQEENDFM